MCEITRDAGERDRRRRWRERERGREREREGERERERESFLSLFFLFSLNDCLFLLHLKDETLVNLLSLLFGGARGTLLDERRGDEEETGRTEAGFRFLKTKKRSLSIDATLFLLPFFSSFFRLRTSNALRRKGNPEGMDRACCKCCYGGRRREK